MARYAMTVDQRLCVTCNACVLACKNENAVPAGRHPLLDRAGRAGRVPQPRRRDAQRALQPLRERPLRRGLPDAARATTPRAASWRWTRRSASAARPASLACPYEARYLHPDGYVDKCNFCENRVRERQEPGMRRRLPHRRRSPSAICTIRTARCTSCCRRGSSRSSRKTRTPSPRSSSSPESPEHDLRHGKHLRSRRPRVRRELFRVQPRRRRPTWSGQARSCRCSSPSSSWVSPPA